jgi:Putative F0F1-ATPase subunit Ca2+/Mg2+ transporter
MESKNHQSISPEKPAKNPLIRFSGLGLQMGITIAVFAYAGRWMDHYFAFDKPILTAIFSLLAVFGSMYLLIKNLSKD